MNFVDVEHPQNRQFRFCFDTLCDDFRIHLLSEADQRRGESSNSIILIDLLHKTGIQLNDVWFQPEDMPKTCITRAGIINGKSKPLVPQWMKQALNSVVIFN